MKISDVIQGLQGILDKCGDLDCYYAIDEESNGYHKVNYESSTMFKHVDEDDYYQELYSQESLDEIKQDTEDDDEEFDFNEWQEVCCIN